jgi:hypothetical protein
VTARVEPCGLARIPAGDRDRAWRLTKTWLSDPARPRCSGRSASSRSRGPRSSSTCSPTPRRGRRQRRPGHEPRGSAGRVRRCKRHGRGRRAGAGGDEQRLPRQPERPWEDLEADKS